MIKSLIKLYVLFLFSWLVSSCGDQQKDVDQNMKSNQVENSKTKVNEVNLENLSVVGDTINLVGKHILFFGPSEAIIKERKIDVNALQMFNQIAQSLIDSIGSITPQAKASMTTAGHVRIYGNSNSAPKMIILSTFSESFGMVISDGTNLTPIIKGVRTREDYERQIRRTLNFENP